MSSKSVCEQVGCERECVCGGMVSWQERGSGCKYLPSIECGMLNYKQRDKLKE